MQSDRNRSRDRQGVVGVVVRDQRLLVIRRAQHVTAPGAFCFPGGGIEIGESEATALRREMMEELAVVAQPQKRLWKSITPWGVRLSWWQTQLERESVPVANPQEVASVHWMTTQEMRSLSQLLESNHHFLDAMDAGQFSVDELQH